MKKKYAERDKNKPAFKSYYKSKKNNIYDLQIDREIIEDPNNAYWISLADRMKLDVHTCYADFLYKYFKTVKPNNINFENLLETEDSWLKMSFKLNINPVDCIKRYFKLVNTKSTWSKEEDARLLDLISKFNKRWAHISTFFSDKSRKQCLQRFKKLTESIKKGKWSPEEDEALKQAFSLHSEKGWSFISQFVKGRSDSQCRERWINSLNPNIKKGKWSVEEDNKLKELILIYKEDWEEISKEIKCRNEKQCKRRYKTLNNNKLL